MRRHAGLRRLQRARPDVRRRRRQRGLRTGGREPLRAAHVHAARHQCGPKRATGAAGSRTAATARPGTTCGGGGKPGVCGSRRELHAAHVPSAGLGCGRDGRRMRGICSVRDVHRARPDVRRRRRRWPMRTGRRERVQPADVRAARLACGQAGTDAATRSMPRVPVGATCGGGGVPDSAACRSARRSRAVTSACRAANRRRLRRHPPLRRVHAKGRRAAAAA